MQSITPFQDFQYLAWESDPFASAAFNLGGNFVAEIPRL